MALTHRDVILSAVALFIAWGYLVHYVPSLRFTIHALLLGAIASPLGILYLILTTSRGSAYALRAQSSTARPRGLKILERTTWVKETAALRARSLYKKEPLYPGSFLVSDAVDELLDLILRDFVKSWYKGISPNPTFPNSVDAAIRSALKNLLERLLTVDLVEVVAQKFVPIFTEHARDFYDAERAVRGKHLNRSVTESEELDLAIAGRYRGGQLHEAASLGYNDLKIVQQEYLRKKVKGLLPQVLGEDVVGSRAVCVLIEELVSCAVLLPVMNMLADPDTWNQIMEGFGRTMLQDRRTVRKLRKALDEHASPAPKVRGMVQFPRLAEKDNERKFEKFVRAIRRCNNLSDARRFRSEVSSQLKRDKGSVDPVYLRRLEIGKRALDQRVTQLAAGGSIANGSQSTGLPVEDLEAAGVIASRFETGSLVDMLHDSSGLSYFMEYMDRHNMMPMVQFWIVVDGFRNPLEDDAAEDDDLPTPLPLWTDADRLDLAQIHEAYLSRPELDVPESSRIAVQTFLKAGKAATGEQYFKARQSILRAQTAALEKMQTKYFAGFKKSDLFYKCLTSQEATRKMAFSNSSNPFDGRSSPTTRPVIRHAVTSQAIGPKSTPASRMPSRMVPKIDLRRAAFSSTDLSANRQQLSDLTSSRNSLDGHDSLFGDLDDSDPMGNSVQSLDQDQDLEENQTPDQNVVQAMEAALNNIMDETPGVEEFRGSLFGEDQSPQASLLSPQIDSPRSSMDVQRTDFFSQTHKEGKPSISSLGLVNTSSRIGVFTDDDLFPDEEKFISDEHDDPEDRAEVTDDEIHEAAPGDLGLAEAISALTIDIDRLSAQNAIIDSLLRKAELTNNTAELRILRKSKASLHRETRRKELQRQQYVVQESDNSLYGRSTVRINKIMVGKEDDGREYAVYVVEVSRKAGEQMPAASWAVTRRYSEFHDLHQRLREKYPSVRNLDFPRRRMVMKLQNDFLQKRRIALEKYLRELLLLPDVCRSRDLRAFLSQSVIALGGDESSQQDKKDMITRFYNSVTDGMEDILGNIPVLDQLSVAGQNLLTAATSQLTTMPNTINEDPLTAAEAEAELNAFEDKELEPFVKPICDIFLELFELNRGNNWLRGRAVVVVLHQLLGGTIERKVRENVKSLVAEDAILRYIKLLRDSMWPGGVKREGKPRTKSEKTKSRTEASLMLATLVPDLAGSVVGRVNAQAASRRIFATLNNPRLNNHLAFTLFDEVIEVLFGRDVS